MKSRMPEDEVRRLVAAAQAGDRASRDAIVMEFRGLAHFYAKFWSRLAPFALVDLPDLIHDGVIGILFSIDRYQPKGEVPFRCYAEMNIRSSIRNAARREKNTIAVPGKHDDARRKLEAIPGHELMTDEELSKSMGHKTTRLVRRVRFAARVDRKANLDLPVKETPVESAMRSEAISDVRNELAKLPAQSQVILSTVGEKPSDIAETAESLGLTVTQLASRKCYLLKKLRPALEGHALAS